MDKNKCGICGMRSYILCDSCNVPTYFCCRGHLHTHNIRQHKFGVKSAAADPSKGLDDDEMKCLFEDLQRTKQLIEDKSASNNFSEAIVEANKAIGLSKKFYKEDHIFVLDTQYKLGELYMKADSLEEAISTLETVVDISNACKITSSIANLRYKTLNLIGCISMNLGENKKAAKVFHCCENEVFNNFSEPEMNIKLAAIYMNLVFF